MKPRQQRMLAVGLAALGIAIAAGLTLRAFEDNMMFFVEISEVATGNYPQERNFRIGGLVVTDSVQREDGSLDVNFEVTDTRCTLDVTYSGVLPDLFREGQGVVAHGRMGQGGVFEADKILAKHDENYMAPEVADSLGKHVQDKTAAVAARGPECQPK
ncbi:MAG: cytochrome c maturation protein CcmE [Gammaproteobacteria bacterium]|nr:cytochrome c maturation protein CcmE [Gammaproteobacteria bacterium]NNF48478.1 cytochrome c maturation protein CcmE [Woeseiaceae bacterium]NNL63277.1 cytochrome c maturation protein CcmE [Woeseiaceae bacterium]